MKRWMAGVAVGLAAAGAGAGDIYSDEDEFVAAIGDGYSFNPFDDVEPGFQWPLFYSHDGFGYEVTAPGDLFCGPGEVSTKIAGKPLVVDFYETPVTAVGGDFWVRDANFNVIPGQVTLVYDDGTKDVFPSDAKGTFRGYVSGGVRISQVQVEPLADGGGDGWAVMDNLYADSSGVFADEDDFLGFLGVEFFNPFDDVKFGPVSMLKYGPRRGFSYTIGAPSGLFCNTGEVSTAIEGDPIEVELGGNEADMLGGRYWVRDANFGVVPGWITLMYGDGTEDVFFSASKSTFRGYRALGSITTVRVFAEAGDGNGWPAIDDVWVGDSWGEYCYGDCNGDMSYDLFDFLCFITEFNAGTEYADCNVDGIFDLFDFLCYQNAFNASC